MRRGPLLGFAVFLVSTGGGYYLGVKRRARRLERARERVEAAPAPEAASAPPPEVRPSTAAAAPADLPSDFRRPESVPSRLE